MPAANNIGFLYRQHLLRAMPVLFFAGLCGCVAGTDRDQAPVLKSLETFNRLRKQFPRDTYSSRAVEYIRQCRESIAGHEFHIGVFYFRTKHYISALDRFKKLLSQYRDIEKFHEEARDYIQQCEANLEKEKQKD